MYTTVEAVKTMTNYDVTPELIFQAQVLIEAIVGKVESEVDSAADLALLGKATAFQAVYMLENYDSVYQQIGLRMLNQSDGNVMLDTAILAPYMAPLAMFALSNLSWRRSRSVKTGKILHTAPDIGNWWTD
jgi:hypothetical protein